MNKRRDDIPSGPKPVPGRPVPKNLGSSGRRPAARGPRDYTVNDDVLAEIDDFRPPHPKNPLAGAKPGVVIGATLTIAAILCLVVFPFLPVNFPTWTTLALIGVILLGLVILFLQMPSKRSSSDDGARV
ncbi:hypothetical protein [Nesterenkonia flava]|uniref:Tripartite tricarboxylate transporter TctB family protein n=1 Tax=Nesterenkonia flava TaxID=469799 RepID=A0ABU1FWD6_9MICC|nr:hypothetical protein [Nesterenkonia flava]MDR5713001.1 hypothetical protein [Nesterenkonia flava]